MKPRPAAPARVVPLPAVLLLATLLLAVTALAAPVPARSTRGEQAGPGAAGNGVAASVVSLHVYRSPADWSTPWRQEQVSAVSGSGFFIEGGRILTNAHVVADARQILVRRPDQANPYVATVEMAGHDCDLAVLRVADPDFALGLRPLPFGGVPPAGTRVLTYGFPLGGQDVSSTAGIVSRIESRPYVHSGADSHLVVQTDAAINPGNSGGPVVQEGRVVGVAFQGYAGAENMGFFIPIPIVRHFLDNLKDGSYDGFPDSGLDTMALVSPALRRERALPPGRSGVVVERIAPGGTFDGVLRAGEVLLSIQGQPIANDGTIRLGEARVTFEHAVDMLQVGEPARLEVWRAGAAVSVLASARRITRYDLQRNRYDVAPRYVVYAGLVFMDLEIELLKTFGRNWPQTASRELVWQQIFREAERPAEADSNVVVLTRVLRHAVNSQMALTAPLGVETINGRQIRTLADVREAFAANTGRFHLIGFEGQAGIEALEREQADAAHPEILEQYGIPSDHRL